MSCLVHHGYEHEDPNSREKDEYSNLGFDFSEEGRQNHKETENLLQLAPCSSEENANRNRPKSGTKKKPWIIKYFSFFGKLKQSKTSSSSSQKKQASYSYNFTYKSKYCPKLGSAARVACKLASIHEAIRRTASGPSVVSCFHPKNAEETVGAVHSVREIGVSVSVSVSVSGFEKRGIWTHLHGHLMHAWHNLIVEKHLASICPYVRRGK